MKKTEVDSQEVMKMYNQDNLSINKITKLLKCHCSVISNILKDCGVLIIKGNMGRTFTETHKENISKGRSISDAVKATYQKRVGVKASKQQNYKNMVGHILYDVSLDWAEGFEDIEKLKFLNFSISRSRDKNGWNTEEYMKYIEHFYHDAQFNNIYDKWISNDKEKWLKPSLDHIIPKSEGGSLFVDNLQFLTWFENRAKVDMIQNEWNIVKENITQYFK